MFCKVLQVEQGFQEFVEEGEEESMEEKYNLVMEKLKELDIDYKIVKHPPAVTTELADLYIEGHEGVRTKTMFLTNKKKTAYYLIVMDEKRMDIKTFKKLVGDNKVCMASDEDLTEKMEMISGIVSIFGLLFNKDKDIQVFMDEDVMKEEILTFHPCTNEETLFLKTTDACKFLNAIGYEYQVVNLVPEE